MKKRVRLFPIYVLFVEIFYLKTYLHPVFPYEKTFLNITIDEKESVNFLTRFSSHL